MKRFFLCLFSLFGSFARPGFALPVLYEVYYDAPGADAGLVFTELAGTPGTTFEGWRLVGVDGANGLSYRSIDLTGAVIPADGILLIVTARAVLELLSMADFVADVDWQNGPDAVELRDALGGLVDALQYGQAGDRILGEGLPAPDPPGGLALTRMGPQADTNDNATDFVVAEPTPGAHFASVSEPATAMLLVFALGGLGATRRRRSRHCS
jgi:MYXO-CTERM domain-containing protein